MSYLKRKPPGPAARITGWMLKRPRRLEPSSNAMMSSHQQRMRRRKFWSQSKSTMITRPLRNFGTQYMPNQFQTRFIYTIDVGLTVGASGVSTTALYRGNSIYDPDYSGVGTRAMGASEMSNIYDNYRVIGSRITAAVSGKTVTNPLRFTVFPTRDTAAVSSAVALAHPNGVRCQLAEGLERRQVKSYCKTAVLFGVNTLEDVAFGSAMASSPTNVWYWYIGITGSENDQANVCLTIEYYTVCYNPVTTYQAAL